MRDERFTEEQVKALKAAIYPFVEPYRLPMNPEDVELLAVAVVGAKPDLSLDELRVRSESGAIHAESVPAVDLDDAPVHEGTRGAVRLDIVLVLAAQDGVKLPRVHALHSVLDLAVVDAIVRICVRATTSPDVLLHECQDLPTERVLPLGHTLSFWPRR